MSMQRLCWYAGVVGVGVGLVLGSVIALLAWQQEIGPFATSVPATAQHTESAPGADADADADSSRVVVGDASAFYFSERELAEIGQAETVEPTSVRYWSELEFDRFSEGCQAMDCIPSIDEPRFTSAENAAEWIPGDMRLISVTRSNGDGTQLARAYPFGVLNYHEVVNDTLNGRPILVTYCPLCRSALVFERPERDGEPLAFGVAGRLYNDNLILYDRATGSYWSQIERRPIVGPLVGRADRLSTLRMNVVTWADWRERHPQGQVLARPQDGDALGGRASYSRPTVPSGAARGRNMGSRYLFDYTSDLYAEYAADPQARSEALATSTDRLSDKTPILGVELDGRSVAYPEELLQKQGRIEDEIGAHRIVIRRTPEGEVEAVRRTDTGKEEPLPLTRAYWFAWHAFHPQTELRTGEALQQ